MTTFTMIETNIYSSLDEFRHNLYTFMQQHYPSRLLNSHFQTLNENMEDIFRIFHYYSELWNREYNKFSISIRKVDPFTIFPITDVQKENLAHSREQFRKYLRDTFMGIFRTLYTCIPYNVYIHKVMKSYILDLCKPLSECDKKTIDIILQTVIPENDELGRTTIRNTEHDAFLWC